MWRLPGKLNVVSLALRGCSLAATPLGSWALAHTPPAPSLDGHVAVPRPKRRVDLASPLR